MKISEKDSIISVFCAWVKDRPDHIAVIEGDTVVSYAQLYESARKLAAQLSSLGVGKGDVIPIIATRSLCYLEELLAVLMTGAAFAAVDNAIPEERKEAVFRQVNSRYILKDKLILN